MKPPKNPVNRKSLVGSEKCPPSDKYQQKPIRNDPMMFTENVPEGKVEGSIFVPTWKLHTGTKFLPILLLLTVIFLP
ncbi:MAG: hypothetical protein LUD02_12485 [Tannerellaceae bacterium]|nr:hypothetical protein [Tannerellaceae bacterium]MCD8264856.1 hypothetical protein [Tannerellaceae bacterium]